MRKLRFSLLVIIAILVSGNIQSMTVGAQQVETGGLPETTMPLDEDARDRFLDFLGSQDIAPYFFPFANLSPVCSTTSSSLASSGGLTSATSNTPKDFSLGADNSMRAVNLAKQLMTDYSLSAAQAAGIVGNFMHESGASYLPPDINQGESTPAPPKFSGGYGWAQWTDRQRAFINFAVLNGYMASSSVHANDAANYAWLRYELENTEKSTLPAVLSTSTPEESARAFEAKFERAGTPMMTERITWANKLFAALSSGGPLNIESPNPNPETSSPLACTPATTSPGAGDVSALIELAKRYVWVKGVNPEAGNSRQRSSSDNGGVDGYAEAAKAAVSNGWHVGGGSPLGNDCAGFINILMRNSGYEPNWPNQGTDGLANALRNLAGWSEVGKQSSQFSTADLKPGDILVTPNKGHVLIYLGSGAIPGASSPFAEAAYGSNRAPYTMGTSPSFYSGQGGYVVFRKG